MVDSYGGMQMSNCSVKVKTKSNIIIDEKPAIIVAPKSVAIEANQKFKVTASPRSYHIVSPDVYTIKRNSELDPWFEDQINNVIALSPLADEVSDLDNRFTNFQDGVTLEIGYLQDADNGVFNLTLTSTQTEALEQDIGFKEDRYPTLSNYTGFMDFILVSGNRQATFDAFVREVGTPCPTAP